MAAPYLTPSPPPTQAELQAYARIYQEIDNIVERMRIQHWADEAVAKGVPRDEYIAQQRDFVAFIDDYYKDDEELQRQKAEDRHRVEYRKSAYIWSKLGRPPVQRQDERQPVSDA